MVSPLPMAMGAIFPAPGLRQAVCNACRQPTALSASHQDLPACPACGRDALRWDEDVISEGWPHDRENFRGDPD